MGKGLGAWSGKNAGNSHGDRLYKKFEKLHPTGTSKDYAEFASKHAWKNNSIPAHDEAAKAHDSLGNSDRTEEHEKAIEEIGKGNKPSPPKGDGKGPDDIARDDHGRFAPK